MLLQPSAPRTCCGMSMPEFGTVEIALKCGCPELYGRKTYEQPIQASPSWYGRKSPCLPFLQNGSSAPAFPMRRPQKAACIPSSDA